MATSRWPGWAATFTSRLTSGCLVGIGVFMAKPDQDILRYTNLAYGLYAGAAVAIIIIHNDAFTSFGPFAIVTGVALLLLVSQSSCGFQAEFATWLPLILSGLILLPLALSDLSRRYGPSLSAWLLLDEAIVSRPGSPPGIEEASDRSTCLSGIRPIMRQTWPPHIQGFWHEADAGISHPSPWANDPDFESYPLCLERYQRDLRSSRESHDASAASDLFTTT